MAAVNALVAAQRMIDTIPVDGVRNGNFVTNTAMPASSHVRPRALWVLRGRDGAAPVNASLVDSICYATRCNLTTGGRDALGDDQKLDISSAVLMVLGRAAAWRYFQLEAGDISPAEQVVLAHDAPEETIHADFDDAVATAIGTWSGMASRMPGIAWYNALSFEQHNHHHKPEVSKRLATTTITVAGLADHFSANVAAQAEGIVMHDMYHPLSNDRKAALARNKAWARALTKLNFDNLRKRVPVKASDTGLAINYPVLIAKARTYAHTEDDLPRELSAPDSLVALIARYEGSANAAAAEGAIEELRAMSAHLAEASAYVAGFMLGRDRRASEDEDLTLKAASRTNTILGSPAYSRAAGEHPGAFAGGTEAGWAKSADSSKKAAKKAMMTRVRAAMRTAEGARAAAAAARRGT